MSPPDAAPFTLVHGGDVYAPRHRGPCTLLVSGEKIAWVGPEDHLPDGIRRLGTWIDEIDASGCLILPGLIDPHEHTIGAGGEQGYGSRTGELTAEEVLACGITTSIGCLGTDVTTRHLTSLLAKARQLEEQGMSAYMLTGGFTVPPKTITGLIEDDLVIVDKVIGIGEVAISDERACDPSLADLARLITQGKRGGSLAEKAGVTLFHVGEGKRRLELVNDLLEAHDVSPASIIVDHINRTPEHVLEAADLARRGVHMCMDTVDGNLSDWLQQYRAADGPLERLSVCSDARTPGGELAKFSGGLLDSVRGGMPMEDVLPAFTQNTADVWHLPNKGRIACGYDADVLFVNRESLQIERVLARGSIPCLVG